MYEADSSAEFTPRLPTLLQMHLAKYSMIKKLKRKKSE
jgi:hypothetical protein